MGEGVGGGVLAASDVLRVDGEQRLAVCRDHWLVAPVVLDASGDQEGAAAMEQLKGL